MIVNYIRWLHIKPITLNGVYLHDVGGRGKIPPRLGADGKADFRILSIVPAGSGVGRQGTAARDAIYGD